LCICLSGHLRLEEQELKQIVCDAYPIAHQCTTGPQACVASG
jgi:hypothetical protein